MDDTTSGPIAGHSAAFDRVSHTVLLAHVNLMRARNLLWLAAALVLAGIVVSFNSQLVGIALGSVAVIVYFVALAFTSITGNHLGQFGLKYPAAAIASGAVLAQLITPLAGLIAPIAVFLWLKREVGSAYRGQLAAGKTDLLAASLPEEN